MEQADCPSVAQLYREVFAAEPWCENWTAEEAYTTITGLFSSKGCFAFLAEHKRHIVGAIVGTHSGPTGTVRELFVEREHRTCGLGSALLARVLDSFSRAGVTVVKVMTLPAGPAYQFYTISGFGNAAVSDRNPNRVVLVKHLQPCKDPKP